MDTTDFDLLSNIFKKNDPEDRGRPQSMDGIPLFGETVPARKRAKNQNNQNREQNQNQRLFNTHSIILPKVNHALDNNARGDVRGVVKKRKGDDGERKTKHEKTKPPTAWPEQGKDNYKDNYRDNHKDNIKQIEKDNYQQIDSKFKMKPKSILNDKQSDKQSVVSELLHIQQSLLTQKQDISRNENQDRLRIMKNANTMVQRLPLQYLFSKPELKHYAIEQTFDRFRKFAVIRRRTHLLMSFYRWKYPPEIKLNDRQIGFMVVAKALQSMLDRMIGRAFKHWSIFYSMRYNHLRKIVLDEAAIQIQRWFRMVSITRRVSYARLWHAIKMCLHRRKAFKYMINFEVTRRKALIKVTKGILARRRYHFAARAIQRTYRWMKLYKKTTWRLTRLSKARMVQRWWRMQLVRDSADRDLIKTLLRAGGYSKIAKKVVKTSLTSVSESPKPKKGKKKKKKVMKKTGVGVLAAADACIRLIQKTWLNYRGMLALLLKFKLRRIKIEHQKMRIRMIILIQSSYRAHLWNVLMLAAVQNNRARRIQKCSRAYQYRSWIFDSLQFKAERKQKIQRRTINSFLLLSFYKVRRRNILNQRYLESEDREYRVVLIQRSYRDALARRIIKRRLELKAFQKLRETSASVRGCLSMIQRNWRQVRWNASHFPYHVKLCINRILRLNAKRLYNAAFSIQKLAIYYIRVTAENKRLKDLEALPVLRRVAKSYLLRLRLWDLVVAKRKMKVYMANKIRRWLRRKIFVKNLQPRFAAMLIVIEHRKMISRTATFLQRFFKRKRSEYYSALRVAGRRQLEKRRVREALEIVQARELRAGYTLQKLFKGVAKWARFLRQMKRMKNVQKIYRSARRIQRFVRAVKSKKKKEVEVDDWRKKREEERIRKLHLENANIIGKYWRRSKEKKILKTLFILRRKMINECNLLEERRAAEEKARIAAEEEVRRSEITLAATVAGAWKQGSDAQGRNYYYNYISGESSWVPPEHWKVKSSEAWVRNTDDRDNVFYYNIQTGESRWLPPCCVCGGHSDRYCGDCTVSYCEADYIKNHEGEGVDPEMVDHKWTAMETEKEALKPGEAHCIECKKRVATIMCTACWDPYCTDCFRFVHHTGALKGHKPINYRKAKLGWLCIKARGEDEKDYYVHGSTGQTTYEKPEDLMTENEKYHFGNFKTHKEAAEEHVKKIEKLQIDLEGASYERDTILFDAINGTGKIGQLLRNRNKDKNKNNNNNNQNNGSKKYDDKAKQSTLGGIMSLFKLPDRNYKIDAEYTKKIMTPNPRIRGQARNNYIQNIIESAITQPEK